MPNPRPRKKPAFVGDPSWIDSGIDGTPRQPAIERLEWGYGDEQIRGGRRAEEVSLGLRFSRRASRAQLIKAIKPILTWVLFETSGRKRTGPGPGERYERIAVLRAWNDGSARKRSQTRDYISDKTKVPEHRVKIILRDWRSFLRIWNSPEGKKARRRMKRDVLKGRHIDSRFFDPAQRFIILGRHATKLS
jgi:hypothetical protein